MNTKTVRHLIEAGIAAMLLVTTAFPGQMDPRLAQLQQQMAQVQQARQQNAQALKMYQWKSRTEIQRGGETKNVQLALMRYDASGNEQKTPMSSSPQQQLPTRGLRGLIAQKKKENFMETLEDLARVARAYSELSPEAMQRFFSTASFTPEISPQQKLFRISGGNVLQPGDSMTIWVDALSRKQRRVEIHTSLDRKPVTIVSDFADLQPGPSYVARTLVDYPSDEIKLITENFDYERVR